MSRVAARFRTMTQWEASAEPPQEGAQPKRGPAL
jgi:hypothetical protein